jgi:membrane-bound lytic murein transglycosylase F
LNERLLCRISWSIVATVAMMLLAPRAGAQGRSLGTAFKRADSARAKSHDDSKYDEQFKKYSKRYFGAPFDWRYFKAQGMAESELNANARSYVGARGIMQLMPATFALIAAKRSDFKSIDDPEYNIAAGIMHDRWLWTVWQKRVPDPERHRFMFASYNAGEGPILRACLAARGNNLSDAQWTSIEQVAPKIDRWRYRETLGYVKKIDANYARLKKQR